MTISSNFHNLQPLTINCEEPILSYAFVNNSGFLNRKDQPILVDSVPKSGEFDQRARCLLIAPETSLMPKGYFSLLLHAHLPFVRHPEYPDFLEEDWLFEAITETYLPLWQVFEGLVRDGIPFQITMSLTPTLCAMLDDELLRERYLRYLDR